MNKILAQIEETNALLTKMEEHLRSLTLPPDLREYKRKGFKEDTSISPKKSRCKKYNVNL